LYSDSLPDRIPGAREDSRIEGPQTCAWKVWKFQQVWRSLSIHFPSSCPCRFVETTNGMPQQWYVNARSDLVPWPESLLVQVSLRYRKLLLPNPVCSTMYNLLVFPYVPSIQSIVQVYYHSHYPSPLNVIMGSFQLWRLPRDNRSRAKSKPRDICDGSLQDYRWTNGLTATEATICN
jgi:hypothetical protein